MAKQTTDKHGTGKATLNGNTRVAGLEQFYTPRELADELTAIMFAVMAEHDVDPWAHHWIEPAVGTGNFAEALLSLGVREEITSVDIEPRYEGAIKANYLEHKFSSPPSNVTAAITNPPFGRNSSLAAPFFNKLVADGVAWVGFLVPRSWRKWALQNRLDLSAHLVHDVDVDVNYVDEKGNPIPSKGNGILRTVFQVWRVLPQPRSKVIIEDRGYITKCSPAEADVALVFLGHSCGQLLTDFDRSARNATHLYLKVASDEVLSALRAVDYSRFFLNTAFVESLSIREVRFLLNEHFDSLG